MQENHKYFEMTLGMFLEFFIFFIFLLDQTRPNHLGWAEQVQPDLVGLGRLRPTYPFSFFLGGSDSAQPSRLGLNGSNPSPTTMLITYVAYRTNSSCTCCNLATRKGKGRSLPGAGGGVASVIERPM